MDKDVLINTLNRLEDKVDKISSGLSSNTSVTESHTKMLGDVKNVHDLNSRVILETRDEIKDLKNEVIKINSWKDGQIEYQGKVMTDVRALQDKVDPMYREHLERSKKKEQVDSQFSKIRWGVLEKLLILVAGATLVSLPTIIKVIYENIK